MKQLSIALLFALAALAGVAGINTAWAGSDEATGQNSIQSP